MSLADFMQKDTAGMPNWVWATVVVVGLGVGALAHHMFSKGKDDNATSHSNKSNNASVADNYPTGDSLEGGFPIAASQTNTSLPYAGLPANTYALIGEGGLGGLPPELLTTNPYWWSHWRHHRHMHGKRPKRGESRRRHDMNDHNLEGHGSLPVASRVGSR